MWSANNDISSLAMDNGLAEQLIPNFINKIGDEEDGSTVYEFSEEEDVPEEKDKDFDRNLVEEIDEGVRDRIANELLEDINLDIESRKEWELAYNKGIKYLGFQVEEFKDYPFKFCSSAFDSTLSTSLLRFWSSAKAELFPESGPAKGQVQGKVDEEAEGLALKQERWFNHYLTQIDKEYYPDSDRLIIYTGMVGCGVRKVYADPLTGLPKARFINPENFIVNNDCVTILSSTRLTHREYLSKREILLRIKKEFYADVDFGDNNSSTFQDNITADNIRRLTGIQEASNNKKSLYTIYEVHAELVLDGFEDVGSKDTKKNGMPLPYVITISDASRKILSIRRNWLKEDKFCRRVECFVLYNYLPGFGIYGLGLAQILGSNAIALTSILRQLIDKGMLCNFPGGFRRKGIRIENNNKNIGPSEFWEIETGGLPVKDVIMPMPYGEPSQVLNILRNELITQTQNIPGSAEANIADSKPDAPVGTTLALLEVANKVQSSVLRGFHTSLSNEFELLYKIFAEGLIEPYRFSSHGYSDHISQQDFNERVRVLPVSDPNLTTSTQRILRAEGILRIAQTNPSIHDMRDAYYRMYLAMGVENIDRLLPPEKEAIPLDPVTENMNAFENKPLKAAVWQDHVSHMAVHQAALEQNPDLEPQLGAHIGEHRAYHYYLEMQEAMQMEMPPLENLMDPKVQNAIALKATEAANKLKSEQEAKNPPPLDPNAVMMADIEARKESEQIKLKIAEMKTETDAFKAQMNMEIEKIKIESQESIAEAKNELDLLIAEIKSQEANLKLLQAKREMSNDD